MGGLTWVHLSDWQQKVKDFDRQMVRDALIDDIERRKAISPDLAKIDFIVFSGDVAYSPSSSDLNPKRLRQITYLLKSVLLRLHAD